LKIAVAKYGSCRTQKEKLELLMFLSTQAHDANFGKFLLLSCSCMPAAAKKVEFPGGSDHAGAYS
jgi:hypothetical protein